MKRTANHWTAAEDAVLRNLYPTALAADILAALPGRTWRAARGHAGTALKLKRPWPDEWPEADAAYVRAHYAVDGGNAVAAHLGVPLERLHRWAGRHGIGAKDATWPAAADALVRQHYPAGMPLVALAQLVGRPVDAVVSYCCRNRILRTIRSKRTSSKPPVVKVARIPKPKAIPKARAARPAPAPKPVRLAAPPKPAAAVKPAPVKKAPGTPRLHQQKLAAAQSKEARKLSVVYTCEEIKRLDLNDPIRKAHWQNGDQGVRAYLASLLNQQAA